MSLLSRTKVRSNEASVNTLLGRDADLKTEEAAITHPWRICVIYVCRSHLKWKVNLHLISRLCHRWRAAVTVCSRVTPKLESYFCSFKGKTLQVANSCSLVFPHIDRWTIALANEVFYFSYFEWFRPPSISYSALIGFVPFGSSISVYNLKSL